MAVNKRLVAKETRDHTKRGGKNKIIDVSQCAIAWPRGGTRSTSKTLGRNSKSKMVPGEN